MMKKKREQGINMEEGTERKEIKEGENARNKKKHDEVGG